MKTGNKTGHSRPPALVTRLLELFLSPDHDSLIGDMEEEYVECAETGSPARATVVYCLQALRILPVFMLTALTWSFTMLKNYLKITLRTLLKYKTFSLINVLGLAIGMPVCLLIILLIRQQSRMDDFHQHKDLIYRIVTKAREKASGNSTNLATVPGLVAQTLKKGTDGITEIVRFSHFYGDGKLGDKVLPLTGFYTDASFFDVFSFKLESGNPGSALDEPFSMVLSREAKRRFFGEEPALGQVLSFSFGEFKITGILQALPEDRWSHLEAEAFISFSTLNSLQQQDSGGFDLLDWQEPSRTYTYLQLEKSVKPELIENALLTVNKRFSKETDTHRYSFSLQALDEIALGPEFVNKIGDVMEDVSLYIFLIVAVVIMLPVFFNYVSLTVARSLKRAKEIGVRKVAGANRLQIVRQFLAESAVVALLSLVPATLLLHWLLPLFNQFDFVQYITIDWKTDIQVYLFFIVFSVISGLLAGLLPAVYLSAMKPAQVIKGLSRIQGFSKLTLRKTLLTVQFTLSMFFILFATLVHKQMNFMLHSDYNFRKENVLSVELRSTYYERFRHELQFLPGVLGVSATSHLIGRVNARPYFPVYRESSPEAVKMIPFSIDALFLDQLDFTLVAGRSFSSEFSTDSSQAVILNEKAVKRLGFESAEKATGSHLTVGERDMQVIGVVADFHYSRLQNEIEPVVLLHHPDDYRHVMISLLPGDPNRTVEEVQKIWNSVNPAQETMRYWFLDDYILGAYNDGRDIATFLKIIAGVAIFLSCLGLLGMAMFNTETRLKEIGIRKVLGAGSFRIVSLLSKDLLQLLLISVTLATVIGVLFIRNVFMQQFPYRTEAGLGLFLFAFLIVGSLALLTIGTQTFRAALTNPVETLRNE